MSIKHSRESLELKRETSAWKWKCRKAYTTTVPASQVISDRTQPSLQFERRAIDSILSAINSTDQHTTRIHLYIVRKVRNVALYMRAKRFRSSHTSYRKGTLEYFDSYAWYEDTNYSRADSLFRYSVSPKLLAREKPIDSHLYIFLIY